MHIRSLYKIHFIARAYVTIEYIYPDAYVCMFIHVDYISSF